MTTDVAGSPDQHDEDPVREPAASPDEASAAVARVRRAKRVNRRKRLLRPIMRTAVEVGLVLFLYFHWVSPGVDVVKRDADSSAKPVSAISMVVPDSTGIADASVFFSSRSPFESSKFSTVSISVDLNQGATPKVQPYVVFSGKLGEGFDSCSGGDARVRKEQTFDSLDEPVRSDLLNQWTAQFRSFNGEDDENYNDQQARAAKSARSQVYTVVELTLSYEPQTQTDGTIYPEESAQSTCRFRQDATWLLNGPDSTFQVPHIFYYFGPTVQEGWVRPSYSATIGLSDDLSVKAVDTAASTQQESVSWSGDDACSGRYTNDDKSTNQSCGSILGTLISDSRTRSDQSVLYIAGIALGVAGGVAANSIRSVLEGLLTALYAVLGKAAIVAGRLVKSFWAHLRVGVSRNDNK